MKKATRVTVLMAAFVCAAWQMPENSACAAQNGGAVRVDGQGVDVSGGGASIQVGRGVNVTGDGSSIQVNPGGAGETERRRAPSELLVDGVVAVQNDDSGTDIVVGDSGLSTVTKHTITEAQMNTLDDLDFDPSLAPADVIAITKVEPLYRGQKESALKNGWGVYFVEDGMVAMVQFEDGKVTNIFKSGTYNGVVRNGNVELKNDRAAEQATLNGSGDSGTTGSNAKNPAHTGSSGGSRNGVSITGGAGGGSISGGGVEAKGGSDGGSVSGGGAGAGGGSGGGVIKGGGVTVTGGGNN